MKFSARLFWFVLWIGLIFSPIRGRTAQGERNVPEFTEEVFLTEETALKTVFPENAKILKEVHHYTESEKKAIESRLGWTVAESSFTAFEGFLDGKSQGWAVITEEIGKFKPITFIIKVSNEGKVERVEVMVYREAVGSEVRRQRFMRQFKGKSAKDPLRINRDILNVTGATMSVQAITAGVKKTLVILDELHFKRPQ